MTLSFNIVWIPILITVITCGYAVFIHDNGGGYCDGIGNVILLVPALLVSMLSWMIWGIFT